MSDINHVVLVGRLTRDPEVRHTAGGMPIVNIGLAVNGRQKDASGQWGDKPNFFDVKLFGERFERAAQRLQKGSRIGIDGRLEWSQWETDGQKRSKVEVVANELQFLDSRTEGGFEGQAARPAAGRSDFAPSDLEPDTSDFAPVGAGAGAANDDDIPF